MYYYYCWSCTTPLYVYAMMYTPSENRLSFSSHIFLVFFLFWKMFIYYVYQAIISISQAKQRQFKELSFIASCYEPRAVLEFFTDIISISCTNSIRVRLLIFILQIKTKYQRSWFKYLRSEIKSDGHGLASYM